MKHWIKKQVTNYRTPLFFGLIKRKSITICTAVCGKEIKTDQIVIDDENFTSYMGMVSCPECKKYTDLRFEENRRIYEISKDEHPECEHYHGSPYANICVPQAPWSCKRTQIEGKCIMENPFCDCEHAEPEMVLTCEKCEGE